MQESMEHTERMIEHGRLKEDCLLDMIERKRERLLRQPEDIDSV